METPITDGPHETPEFIDDGIPFVSAEAVSSGEINFSKSRFISHADHHKYSKKYKPRRDDIFMVKSGATTGVVALVSTDRDFNIWSPLAVVRCSRLAFPRYILQTMRSRNFQESVILNWSFGTQQNIGMSVIENLRIPLPPISEQNQIARFLDHETARIDALIEEQQRLIELLKEKRQAVISHAVTKGLDPTVPMKDSGAEWLGEVPAHWETLRIGAVYSEAADKGLAELPVLRVSIHHGVSDKELSEEESDRKITRIDDREKYKRVRPGDLVYNMMRAWQGGFGAVLVNGLVSPAYVVARPKNEDISRYVEQLLRTGCAVEEMRKNSYGITDFRLRLYWDQFKNIVIVIPPEVERLQIMERIDSLINESEALKSEADRLIVILQERRSALISAAVTGKIDVRGWQPPARAQAPVLEAEAV
ncbi:MULTISPECIES: restriction endonuclease subunit S [Pseudomonas syringae group]|uniref:restriction endonuclease subunit S n=1 Tax=Pseudomonas syringae group TaxID=136849 RepID=UPI0011C3EFFD|nr:restriction endonuclease subunit S [Pseudomonas avellanae]